MGVFVFPTHPSQEKLRMPSQPLVRFTRFGLFPVFLCFLAIGCGGEKKYRISGKVTFKGASVSTGKIYFTPDVKKGGKGPAGYADIKDGNYDTSSVGGSGSIGGPVIVRIEGFTPSGPEKSDKGEEKTAKALFPAYETAIDLPKEVTTKDFDVPATAATPAPKAGASGVLIP